MASAKLTAFLSTLGGLTRARAAAYLAKQFNCGKEGILTVAEQVELVAARPKARISFASCGTTPKRNGVRFDRKPTWAVMGETADGGECGWDVGKIGAQYAVYLGLQATVRGKPAGTDLAAIEKSVMDAWNVENNPTARHRAEFGG